MAAEAHAETIIKFLGRVKGMGRERRVSKARPRDDASSSAGGKGGSYRRTGL